MCSCRWNAIFAFCHQLNRNKLNWTERATTIKKITEFFTWNMKPIFILSSQRMSLSDHSPLLIALSNCKIYTVITFIKIWNIQCANRVCVCVIFDTLLTGLCIWVFQLTLTPPRRDMPSSLAHFAFDQMMIGVKEQTLHYYS